jgi:DNA-directed RNA polymerase subunit RPC12/RpoP
MARAYFKCADCGADVQVISRNRTFVDDLAAWHESQGHVCAECSSKQIVADGATAAAASAADGLPTLFGSEKAAAWGETLRRKLLPTIKAFEDKAMGYKARLESGDYAKPASAEQIEKARREIARNLLAVDVIRGQRRASWWIDNKDSTIEHLLHALRAEIDKAEAAARAAPATTEEAEIKAAAEAESLLKPVGEPVSTQVAEIRHVGDTMRVVFPERIESFRLLLRGAGFEWRDGHWERKLTWMMGAPADRMAELAHRLIGAGFLVRINDDAARAKAIDGDFAPEQRRWCSKINDGEFAGWVRISWPKSDDLYAPARHLRGSRYKAGSVYVPPGSVEEVLDFAERLGFGVSPGVAEMAASHRAALAAGAVIADPKQGPVPLAVPDGPPPVLDVVVGEIDPDLREEA